ncbi:chitinase [Roseateles sp. DAIF2]|uniref:glycosyl hydrolase family 18 protein n=1 Tax=Roseateles sp. DAIF2 TaxID=2714952 RepID=UPI0018A314DA|nr:glycosyl hydrolase family 18 protein [Roseateles sp. DAIF2]QPF73378.1 chitinase [Roseateles sp. DAIF2]
MKLKKPAQTRRALRWTALAAGLLAGSAAQAYDCTGVPEWSPSATYTAGQKAQQNNAAYQANWWTQNNSPATNSGPWAVWKPLGTCDPVGPDITAPSVPGTPTASNLSSNSVTLSWSASTDNVGGSGLAGYELLRGGTLIASPAGNSHTDTGLTAGTNYSYQVRAKDKASNASALSASLLVTTPAPCTSIPATPGGLNSPSQGGDNVNLSWNAVTAGPNCTVQYRVLQGATQATQTALTQASIGGLAPNTTYNFSVVAVSQAGASQPSAPISVTTTGATDKTVLGYFAQWGIYGRNYLVKNIETSGSAPLLTHINYAFGNVRNNRCEVGVTQAVNESTGAGGDAFADYTKSFSAAQSVDGIGDTWNQPLRGNWNQLKKLKAKYPKLKVLISLGGWTYSRGFSEAAKPENRVAFVKSCIDAYIKGDLPRVEDAGGPAALAGVFDGIDLDWEYPNACGLGCGKPEDRENFTGLLAEFRKQLDAHRAGLLLTMAAPAGVDKIRAWDPDKAHPYLNFINVMTYDFHGGWDPITGFHSPLYPSSADPAAGDVRLYNTDDALKAYLNKGVPATKLNLGIGFYGRGWTNVPNVGNGLYQSGVPAPATWEKGNENYKVLKALNWPSFVDPQSRAQWIYNGTTFWSFDTPVQITEKMNYVKTKGLGGAFFWEFDGDDAQGTLIKAISNGLK